MTRTLRLRVFYPHPVDDVWTALTDSRALAEWLMPNNFEPIVGKVFRFHVDPIPGFSGITECVVLAVEPPLRLVYACTPLPKEADAPRPPSMTVVWTLSRVAGGTALVLEHSGVESLGVWWRLALAIAWRRMLKMLLPKVLQHVEDRQFTPGAIVRRDYKSSTVPEGYAK